MHGSLGKSGSACYLLANSAQVIIPIRSRRPCASFKVSKWEVICPKFPDNCVSFSTVEAAAILPAFLTSYSDWDTMISLHGQRVCKTCSILLLLANRFNVNAYFVIFISVYILERCRFRMYANLSECGPCKFNRQYSTLGYCLRFIYSSTFSALVNLWTFLYLISRGWNIVRHDILFSICVYINI